jgi:hypothetical protein
MSRSQPAEMAAKKVISCFFNYLPQLRTAGNPGWHGARTVGQRADAQTSIKRNTFTLCRRTEMLI